MELKLALTVLALLGLSSPVLAADAPPYPDGHKRVTLKAGQRAPAEGLFADEVLAHYDLNYLQWTEKQLESCRVELAKLKPKPKTTTTKKTPQKNWE